jgi:hypothetical protein
MFHSKSRRSIGRHPTCKPGTYDRSKLVHNVSVSYATRQLACHLHSEANRSTELASERFEAHYGAKFPCRQDIHRGRFGGTAVAALYKVRHPWPRDILISLSFLGEIPISKQPYVSVCVRVRYEYVYWSSQVALLTLVSSWYVYRSSLMQWHVICSTYVPVVHTC